MCEAHGLMRKPEDYFVMTDDAAQPQRGNALAIDFQRLGYFACRAGDFRFFPEMLLEYFYIGKRCDLAQQLGRDDQEVDAERDVGRAQHAGVRAEAARIGQVAFRISRDRVDQRDATLAHFFAVSMDTLRRGEVDQCIHWIILEQISKRTLCKAEDWNIGSWMGLLFCNRRTASDPTQFETRIVA